MSIFGIFINKPKWDHSNSFTRREAVNKVTDPQELFRIANEAKNEDTRIQAIGRISDETVLLHFVQKKEKNGFDSANRSKERHTAILRLPNPTAEMLVEVATKADAREAQVTAVSRLADTENLIKVAKSSSLASEEAIKKLDADTQIRVLREGVSSPRARLVVVEKINDSAVLKDVLRAERDASVFRAAVAQLLKFAAWEPRRSERERAFVTSCNDDEVLRIFAFGARESSTSQVAVGRITRQDLLAEIAAWGDFWAGKEAVTRIDDQPVLADIAAKAKDDAVALAAMEKLTDQKQIARVVHESRGRVDRGRLALEKLNDQEELTRIATTPSGHLGSVDSDLRRLIIEKVTNPVFLKHLTSITDSQSLRNIAENRLAQIMGKTAKL